MLEIYMIQKIMQSLICHTILQKCFNECTMNTNSILLGSLSSTTGTVTETTREMTCKSATIADSTSGRAQLWKKCYIEYICVKYLCVHM